MVFALLVLVLVLPFLELWAVVAVAGQIGVAATLLALVALSVFGVWLTKREGVSVWRRVNAELAAGRTPERQLVDGALVLFGGVLLIIPGFITAAAGLLLLLPPTRAVLRPLALRWMGRRRGLATMTFGTVGPNGTTRVWRNGMGRPGSAGARGPTGGPGGTDLGGSYAEIIDIQVDEPDSLGPSSN